MYIPSKYFHNCFYTLYILYYYIRVMKDKQVLIKLSDDEKNAFKKAAELSGLGFSAWARLRMRDAAKKELLDNGEKVDFLNNKEYEKQID